jgi:hypothetical protein
MPELRRYGRIVDAVSRRDSDRWRPPIPGDPDHSFRFNPESGRLQAGIGGRLPSESVVAFALESLVAFAQKMQSWRHGSGYPGPDGGIYRKFFHETDFGQEWFTEYLPKEGMVIGVLRGIELVSNAC